MAQLVENLTGMLEALVSIPSNTHTHTHKDTELLNG
jgi:hypothetical protein